MARYLTICLLLTAGTAFAQAPNLLPNPSFEAGEHAPAQWAISSGGVGRWEKEGHDGARSISVTGKGEDSVSWSASGYLGLKPAALYHTSFWTRRSSGSGRTVISGLEIINRDYVAGTEWERRDFYFRTPDQLPDTFFRLGEWHSDGTIWFDDVSLTSAFAVHSQPEGLGMPLGDGESVTAGRYQAVHHLGGPGATDHRCLERFSAGFNSNRWLFGRDQEVVYRHAVGMLKQTDATVEVAVNYYVSGKLTVEASEDGKAWARLGELTKLGRTEFPLALKAPREVWVRLRTVGDAELQVDGYRFRSTLPEAQSVAHVVGETRYFEVRQSTPGLTVSVPSAVFQITGENRVALKIESETRRAVEGFLLIERDGKVVAKAEAGDIVAPGRSATLRLNAPAAGSGDYTLRLQCRDAGSHQLLWEAEGRAHAALLYDAAGGELLADGGPLSVWWCEPERKVSRTRPAPTAKGEAVRISAAGNEYEAAQVVLTPRSTVRRARLTAGDLAGPNGAKLPAAEITVRLVEYVFTETPTDELGAVDEWPDPLPLHRAPVDLPPGRNQPFWITVHVPAGTPAGDYRGALTLTSVGARPAVPLVEIPLSVRVSGFDLPRETHLRSGFGLDTWNLKRYHNLETDEEVRQVTELYLRDFAAHRISPYDFGRDIGVTWEKDAAGEAIPKLDFTGFDEDAHHALDELGFNSFVLRLRGLGGGTFYERYLGEIAGYKQGTPEYERAFTRYVRAIQDHLEQKGWLRKAYIYWFDEPEEKDTEFVKEGMELLGHAGPKLTRLLTTAPRPALYGTVDLWCLPTFTLDPELAKQRKAAGEELWWYLCTGPKAPYFTLFLDHYGTELRLWAWETWKYGLDGLLVWDTNYWTSGTAYPRPALQNPWQDPMSWTSGYGVPAGSKQPWGNGDGRFFYPPSRDPGKDNTKYLEGPTPSIRWELLRDGIEDYEYLLLLKSEIARVGARPAVPANHAVPTDLADYERLLDIPADICTSTTQFATTPEPIHAHREKVARAIEACRLGAQSLP